MRTFLDARRAGPSECSESAIPQHSETLKGFRFERVQDLNRDGPRGARVAAEWPANTAASRDESARYNISCVLFEYVPDDCRTAAVAALGARRSLSILGSGLMGGKLGTLFGRAGHEVVFSYSRSERKLNALAREALLIGELAYGGRAGPELAYRFVRFREEG